MKPIALIIFKRTPTVKNYFFIFSDKSVILRTVCLYDENENTDGETIVYQRFGKKLAQRKDIHISHETICAMNFISNYEFNVPEGMLQYGKMGKL